MREIWRPIHQSNDYLVSNKGRIKSVKFKKHRILKPQVKSSGHIYVSLRIDGKKVNCSVPKLVAFAFIRPLQDNESTFHKSDDITDNSVENVGIRTHGNYERVSVFKLRGKIELNKSYINELYCSEDYKNGMKMAFDLVLDAIDKGDVNSNLIEDKRRKDLERLLWQVTVSNSESVSRVLSDSREQKLINIRCQYTKAAMESNYNVEEIAAALQKERTTVYNYIEKIKNPYETTNIITN